MRAHSCHRRAPGSRARTVTLRTCRNWPRAGDVADKPPGRTTVRAEVAGWSSSATSAESHDGALGADVPDVGGASVSGVVDGSAAEVWSGVAEGWSRWWGTFAAPVWDALLG